MFKLDASVYLDGLEAETCLLLSSLQNIATLTPPVTVASMRSQLETGQIQPFTTAAFDQYLTRLYGLPLDETVLTAAEITILQNIRDYLQPAPSWDCCGTATPAAGLITMAIYPRIGSGTFEYEIQAQCDPSVTCDLASIQMTITPTGGAPAPTVSPVTLDKLGCVGGSNVFTILWSDYAANPSGFTYDFSLDCQDSTGATLAVVAKTGNVYP